MKVDTGFKQLFRAALAADSTRTTVKSQDGSVMPIEVLRTKLGEKALYDPAVLKLPAFFGTGGTSSDLLRLRPPDKQTTAPHEVGQAVHRVLESIAGVDDPRLSGFLSVLRTLDGFQRNLRPRMQKFEA